MEQMIIEFLAKSSELILHNRLSATQTLEGILNKLTDPNPLRFQLSFEQKFNFMKKIPIQWSTQHHKLLVIEFFVCLKDGSARTLMEQWIFDLNQISESQLENTIDSTNTLYKRLSVLLRSISSLTVTLPFYQLCSKNPQFRIEHSISFTRHTVSKWHPKVYETNDLSEFSCPDFVLPGRTFSFKVNYLKSLHSLPELLQEVDVCEQPLVIPSESGGSSPTIETTADLHLQNKAKLIKRYYSENTSSQNIRRLSNSHIFGSQINSCQTPTIIEEGIVPSPKNIETHINNSPTLKSSLKINSRIRIKTLDSENLGEAEIFICENDEEKFTEVLSLNEINLRTTSSPPHQEAWQRSIKKFSDHEKHRKMSEDFENSRRKLSLNTKPIEKVIEQSDDDKIAELLLSIEGLKVLNSSGSNKSKGSFEESKEKKTQQMGIRFELASKGVSEEFPNHLSELNALRDFYWEIKGSSPIP